MGTATQSKWVKKGLDEWKRLNEEASTNNANHPSKGSLL